MIPCQDRHSHQNLVLHHSYKRKHFHALKESRKTGEGEMAALRYSPRRPSIVRSSLNGRGRKFSWLSIVLHGYRTKSVASFVITKRRRTDEAKTRRLRIIARELGSLQALSSRSRLHLSNESSGQESELFASEERAPGIEQRSSHLETSPPGGSVDVDGGKVAKEPRPEWLMPWLLASSLLMTFFGGGMLIICLVFSSPD